ncbi:4-(cytidine 5'-diphospho)-2-C-methyl-D-erythritol kinase [Parvularcula lutaonensis]|uniref:4-diphosphocytidyl-2-C-methyl-D-erythritol kinase n=1 Tax=Parvularcula lutaonensis TaxID=491923 RepID=A0ABV7M7A7_9PROT|nr:4-(cytidine 5'-diphospho)-2-C-methyl-D-erythritol kinase [Parvularcula lutaonensis]GGY41461.1 4-diphosphocytidyl-2-C-methyl-D-erythritol kinase [Parvularcula lutaonensis]
MTPAIFAPVKINLALHVGPLRADGYHPVDTLCVFPMIGDVISYEPEAQAGIDFGGTFGADLSNEDPQTNLLWRAFRLLDLEPQGRFFLQKETPIASGIGAGTADGVAAMLLLNEVLGLGFDARQLERRALGLGADGPVCMAGQIHGGGILRARGIGEKVEHLGRCEPKAIVLANPGVPVSTGAVFSRFDSDGPEPLEEVRITGRDVSLLQRANGNDLFQPAVSLAPEIADLLDVMTGQPGTETAAMSGSGATCFAIHASRASAVRATRDLQARGYWAESSFILPG